MNSLRAALPRSRNAHGSGAAPRRSIEKSISRATTASCWRLEHAPEIARRHAGPNQQQEQLRQLPDGPDQLLLVGRSEDHVPKRDRAARIEAEQIAGGQDAAHAFAVEYGHVLSARGDHVDRRLDAELSDRHRGYRRTRNRPDGTIEGAPVTRHRGADLGVGHDPELPGAEIQHQRAHAVVATEPAGPPRGPSLLDRRTRPAA